MSFEQIVAFVVFAIVTSITPGPNNVMLTATGANAGVRGGVPHVLGVTVGFALMLFAIAAGAGGALLDSPTAMQVLKVAGIAVLLWLAWKIATAARIGPASARRPIGFIEAAAFQWVNPKAWLICASAVGSFLNADSGGALSQAGLFALIFIVAGTPCMFAWLGFGAAMQRLLTTDRALRSFNIAMGVTLAASVVVLV